MIVRYKAAAVLVLALSLCGAAQAADLIVEKKTFELPSYDTVGGGTIKNVKIGWQAAGTLNADKSNAILITHFSPAPATPSANTPRRRRGRLLGCDHRAGQGDRHRQVLRPVLGHAGQSQRQGAECRDHGPGEHRS
jgi:homoserine acetyltransferase